MTTNEEICWFVLIVENHREQCTCKESHLDSDIPTYVSEFE